MKPNDIISTFSIDEVTLKLNEIKALTLILTDEGLLETQTDDTLISLAYLAYQLTEDLEKNVDAMSNYQQSQCSSEAVSS